MYCTVPFRIVMKMNSWFESQKEECPDMTLRWDNTITYCLGWWMGAINPVSPVRRTAPLQFANVIPQIELTPPTTAASYWAMEDVDEWRTGSNVNGRGHYHETYVVEEGECRIASLQLTRIRIEMLEGNLTRQQ